MFASAARLLIVTILTVILHGCETRPEIRALSDPGANLSSYKTFGFFDAVSTDKSSYTTILSSHLKDATRRELEKRGYQFAAENPQLLVNFNVIVSEQTDVRSYPSGGFYGYHAGMYGAWGGYAQDVETIHYKVGTLSIDLVDAAKKQLVWQGVAEGRIKKESVENPAPAIDRAVGEIFAKFPVQPPVPPSPA